MTVGLDFLAKRLITPVPVSGKVRMAMLGKETKLLTRGNIHAVLNTTADDGTPLHGWYVRSKSEPRGLAICIHGMWDSCGGFYWLARRLVRRGFDVLLPDLRCHGLSEGEHLTWGEKEVDDIQTLIVKAREYGACDGDIYTVGYSLGGGIAVQLAAELGTCRGVVALAPVGSARRIMHHLLRFWAAMLTDLQAEDVVQRAGELARFDIDGASAVEAAEELKCPISIAHGRWDTTVPFEHGQSIADAAGKRLRVFSTPYLGHNSLLWRRIPWIARQLRAMSN